MKTSDMTEPMLTRALLELARKLLARIWLELEMTRKFLAQNLLELEMARKFLARTQLENLILQHLSYLISFF